MHFRFFCFAFLFVLNLVGQTKIQLLSSGYNPVIGCWVQVNNGAGYYSDSLGLLSVSKTNEKLLKLSINCDGYLALDTTIANKGNHIFLLKKQNIKLETVFISDDKKVIQKYLDIVIAKHFKLLKDSAKYNVQTNHEISHVDSGIQEMFLLSGKLINQKNRVKEKITNFKHFTKLSPISPFEQNERWLDSYEVKGSMPAGSVPLYGNEVSDIIVDWSGNQISVPDYSDRYFSSPLSSFRYWNYNFEDAGVVVINQKLLRKINYKPKNTNTDELNGQLYWRESDSTLALFVVEFKRHTLFNLKQLSWEESYNITKNSSNKKQLVLQKVNLNYKFNDHLGKATFKLIEEDFPIWKEDANVIYDLNINNDSLQNNNDLSKEQFAFITVTDSLEEYWNSEAYYSSLDSVKNKITIWKVLLNGVDYYNHKKGYKFWISPVLEQMNVIGVGGYRHSLEGIYHQLLKDKRKFQVSAQADYGFLNNDITGRGRFQYTYNPKKLSYWNLSLGRKYQLLTFDVPVQNLLSRGNYVRNDFIEAEHFTEVFNGFYLIAGVKYSDRTSISDLKLARWGQQLFGNENIPLDFDGYREFLLRFRVEIVPFQKFDLLPNSKRVLGSKFPTFSVEFNQGIPNVFNSSVNFQQLFLEIRKDYSLKSFGNGKVELINSRFIHTAAMEFPNYRFIQGTTPYLFMSPMYSFQLLKRTLRTLSPTFELRGIHHFDGAIWSKIPLLRKLPAETVFGGGALLEQNTNYYHTETFYGIEVPFKMFRDKYKFGVYHAISTFGSDGFQQQIKFGINFYNAFNNTWLY